MTQMFFEECDCDCHKGGVAVAKMHLVPCCWECHFCHKRIKRGIKHEDHWNHCPGWQRASEKGEDKAGFLIEIPLKMVHK